MKEQKESEIEDDNILLATLWCNWAPSNSVTKFINYPIPQNFHRERERERERGAALIVFCR